MGAEVLDADLLRLLFNYGPDRPVAERVAVDNRLDPILDIGSLLQFLEFTTEERSDHCIILT